MSQNPTIVNSPCWQAVYGTQDDGTAAKDWSRMVRNRKAQAYIERRRKEIEAAVT